MAEPTTLLALAGRYDAILLDAFGVLVTHAGAIEGAPDGVRALKAAGQKLFVVTNDASRHPERAAAWYQELDLELEAEEVISSGTLLAGWVERHALQGQPVAVLGTGDSRRMLEEAGARPVDPTEPFEAVALCDESGYPLIAAVEQVLNALRRRHAAGRALPIALANPDVVYPQSADDMGLAVGAIARMLGAACEATLGFALEQVVEPLGKPYPPIFEAAVARAGSRKLLMVGDQLSTDIAGAHRFGIDSALVGSGVHRGALPVEGPQPTWRVTGWT